MSPAGDLSVHSSEPRQVLMLQGLFRALRDAGLKLSTRDYLDGLKFLQVVDDPFGLDVMRGAKPTLSRPNPMPSNETERVRERNLLIWLLSSLWAVDEKERSIIRMVVSREIAQPSAKLSLELHKALVGPAYGKRGSAFEDPLPSTPNEEDEKQREKERQRNARLRKEEIAKAEENKKQKKKKNLKQMQETEPEVAGAEIDDRGDLEVPELGSIQKIADTKFEMKVRPTLSETWLVGLWRRFFIPKLMIDPYEIDAEATVEVAARTGRIIRPKMRKRRENAAKLILLVDVSKAMTPWRSTLDVVIDTFVRESSQFSQAGIAYFRTAPGNLVYLTPLMRRAKPLNDFLAEFGASPIMVIGEAGTARLSELRHHGQIGSFLQMLDAGPPRNVAWINPMPTERWDGIMMQQIFNARRLSVFNLDDESLLEAIDLLRGTQG